MQQVLQYIEQHYLKIISLSLCVLVVVIVITLFKNDVLAPNEIVLHKDVQSAPKNISKHIQEGIALLKASEPLDYVTANNDPDGALREQQIAFALLDRGTNTIFERRYWIEDDVLIPVIEPGIDPIDIKVIWSNGFNSYYDVPSNPNIIVVANKYLVRPKYLPDTSSVLLSLSDTPTAYRDLIYSPYSRDLHWPEVIQEGIAYIQDRMDTAYTDLDAREVHSRYDPTQYITATVDQELLKNIIFIEHIDTSSLLLSRDGGRSLAERVLVIVGANKEWSYRYTGSHAGAIGIAQFIEPTYDLMVDLYPEAGLITDYNLGMANHANAFKAMVLFLDYHKKVLHDGIEDLDTLPHGIEDAMLAATYNGGPSRTIRAVNKDRENWANSSIYVPETSFYIVKYHMIDKLDLF